MPGSAVGAIQLFDDYALVDVQQDLARNVAHALRAAKIKGRKLPVREAR